MEVLRVRNSVSDERNARRRLDQGRVTQLQMAQCAVNCVLRMVVQWRRLDELHANEHERHQGDQQDLAKLLAAIQHGL